MKSLTIFSPTRDDIRELWQCFKGGDERAFGELARVHYRSLYNYGIKLTPDSALVWNTIQDLFLDIWDRRLTTNDAVFVKTYLLKALRYKLLKVIPQTNSIPFDDLALSRVLFDRTVEDQIVEEETRTQQIRQLHILLSLLTKRQQEVLYLRFHQNLDNDEIAQIMGVERQSVANLLHQAVQKLHSQWPVCYRNE